MKGGVYTFESEVWIWPSEVSAWYCASVPKDMSTRITAKYVGKTRGFGSLPVEAQVGKTKWRTSIFPERKSGEYILPIKIQVRRKESILAKDRIQIRITIKVYNL